MPGRTRHHGELLASREILSQAPVASDLRFLLTVLRIPPELERSHDLECQIASPRVYPDLVQLLVSKDRRAGRAVRWRLPVALICNAQPFNVIPDFVPVIGFADNIVVTAWAVHGAVRTSGPAVVLSNWSGSRAGLAQVYRLCRLKISDEEMGATAPRRADIECGGHGTLRA